ncbi:uncharacterized protein [Panulirus ornatus]|uniref:uncharacterized protein n=1 Tax=Panulirus ornatus TaxID=150431 RepID=UPI003A8B4570
MEWANGDIRCNFGRTNLPLGNVQETVVDFHGYQPARGDYPAHTHLEYGTPTVPRPPECTPKRCGYTPPTTHHQYGGIAHPTYQTPAKAVQGGGGVPTYPVEGREYLPTGQRDFPPPTYPAEQCGYPGGARPQHPYLPGGQRSPCVSGTCGECRGGPPTCEFRAPTTCYTTTNECQPRTDLGPPPDIHPEVRPPPDLRPTPDVHRDVPAELRQDPRPECYDSRSLRSHHASHCDLREFQEWREMRGSRESVGTLPPGAGEPPEGVPVPL